MTRTLESSAAVLALLALHAGPATLAQEVPGASPELNESFRDPDVERYVERFESESREVFTRRDEVLKLLALEPGMDVADVGAGTGLYALPMAEAVGPEGAVYAVDIAPNFLRYIASRARKAGMDNVCTVLGSQDAANLPPESVDLVFICDTYHHFEDPDAMLGSIRRALRPGGRLALIEFDRREGVSSDFILEHVRADAGMFIREIGGAGFRRVELEGGPEFEENFFAIFVRDPQPGEPAPAPAAPGNRAPRGSGAGR